MTTLELEVGAVAHGGHCIARHEGRAVFVRHALPGEVVEAAVTEGGEDARFWRADAVTILQESPDRVVSAWPEAGAGGVGGGELAHVALPAQRVWKRDVLREAFERFAGVEFWGDVAAAPGDDDRGGLAYRTRVTAVADAQGRASMKRFRSAESLTLDSMPLATPEAERLLLGARLEPGTRFTVAVSATGDAAVVGGAQSGASVLERIDTEAGPIDYRVRADGFWQVHREAAQLLVNRVLTLAGDADRVADLYAGAGLFGAALAAQGRSVTLVEFDRRAAQSATRNVAPWPTARVIPGDVRRTVASGQLGRVDVVVLDPPRSGAGGATIAALDALKPRRIVYVACDPVALARDVALLNDRGYALQEVEAYDLFPMTHHVEAVAVLSR